MSLASGSLKVASGMDSTRGTNSVALALGNGLATLGALLAGGGGVSGLLASAIALANSARVWLRPPHCTLKLPFS